jgi:hypothetical protein
VPEPETDPAHPSRTLLRRWFKLDIDRPSLPAALRSYLADASRAVPSFTSQATTEQVLALRVVKTSVDDPAVIG